MVLHALHNPSLRDFRLGWVVGSSTNYYFDNAIYKGVKRKKKHKIRKRNKGLVNSKVSRIATVPGGVEAIDLT